jgi:hypothetical protein
LKLFLVLFKAPASLYPKLTVLGQNVKTITLATARGQKEPVSPPPSTLVTPLGGGRGNRELSLGTEELLKGTLTRKKFVK